jgi:Uma2 family endonuclease
MPPTGALNGARNSRLTKQLVTRADRDGSGVAFDSSTAFELPNGAIRGSDAAWVSRHRLTGMADVDLDRFLPLCPDFVVGLRSGRQSLERLHEKMREYVDNGAGLGWLIDPVQRSVHVYRPGCQVEILEPQSVSGDPELPGFVPQLREIWSQAL